MPNLQKFTFFRLVPQFDEVKIKPIIHVIMQRANLKSRIATLIFGSHSITPEGIKMLFQSLNSSYAYPITITIGHKNDISHDEIVSLTSKMRETIRIRYIMGPLKGIVADIWDSSTKRIESRRWLIRITISSCCCLCLLA